MLKSVVLVFVFFIIFGLLFGCGGGGGGKGKTPDVLADLGYTGNTSEAAITTANADDFVGGWINFQSGSSFSLSKPNIDNAYNDYNPLLTKLLGIPIKFNYATETESDTGTVSGSITSTVTTDDSTGRVANYTVVFTNYDDTADSQSNPLNGNVTYSVTEYATSGDPDGSGFYSLNFS
ncbi:MAG: hypothetical protein HZA48_09795, partial [Planctomycetes bacterium]|nr:hypothetical protein [Planctomycetota bacterium]